MALNTFGAWWSSLNRFRHSVVLRLLATVFLFSCVVTLLLTALQLYRDYDRGIERVQNRLASARRSGGSISRNCKSSWTAFCVSKISALPRLSKPVRVPRRWS
jgi:hypothetical protein